MFSAVVYSLGSVIARPLTKTTSAAFLSGLTMLPGGLVLTIGALAFEPGALELGGFHWSRRRLGWLAVSRAVRLALSPSPPICG